MAVYDESTSGGLLAGSTAIITTILNISTSGGIEASGQATNLLGYSPLGGALLDGSASISTLIVFTGGIAGEGSANHTMIMQEPQSVQGIIAGGSANSNQAKIIGFASNGQVVTLSGSASTGLKSVKFNASGSVEISDGGTPTRVDLSNNLILSLNWRIDEEIRKDLTLVWNVGTLQIFWYRIISKEINDCPLDPCCQKFIVNIHARTLAELCEKLSKRGYKFPIQSVQKFTKPAENAVLSEFTKPAGSITLSAGPTSPINHLCNGFEEVEICNIPQCADFCVDQDLKVYFGIDTFAQVDAFFSHEATGSAIVVGNAVVRFRKNLPNFPMVASGSIGMGGSAETQTSSYFGRGGISLGGSATSACSNWTFVAGVWPDRISNVFGTETKTIEENNGEQQWSLTERIGKDDSLYSSCDISYGKKSQLLVAKDFKFNIPENSNVLGLIVRIDRLATQFSIRDKEVVLLDGTTRISKNLANTGFDWPLLSTSTTYGTNGLNGSNGWRDPEDAIFSTQLTPLEINRSSFGVGLKIISNNSLPATVAKVDYIKVDVFYEDPNGSIVRMSGDAVCKGPNYHYQSTGRTTISGSADSRLGFRFVSKGLGSNALPEINITGSANYSYNEIASGGLSLAGDANVSPYMEIASGGLIASGEAEVKPFIDLFDGGISLSGSAYISQSYHYEATGGFELTSLFYIPAKKFVYEADGSIQISGKARIRTENWNYTADGSIQIGGSANTIAGSEEIDIQYISGDMTILQIGAIFDEEETDFVAQPLTGSINACGCVVLPFTIQISHNIARDNNFAKFLFRNNLSISRILKLRYNETNNSWQTNLHYKGLSPDANSTEIWDLIFELQCTDVMGSISVGRKLWKFSIQVFRSILTTGEDFDTRIIVALLPENICDLTGNRLDFEIVYDTDLNLAVVTPNATVYQNTIFDNIGMFKNAAWTLDPDLNIKVSQLGISELATRVNLTNAVLVNG